MGVIAWIVLGMLGVVVARLVAGGRVPHRPPITAVIARTARDSQAFDDSR